MLNFPRAAKAGVTLRDMNEKEDLQLLFNIYVSTREEILAYQEWDHQTKEDFLKQQFELQHNAYLKGYEKDPQLFIVQHNGSDIGRLYLLHRDDDIRIIDIALLPEGRQKGLGTALLQDVLAMADNANKTVSIHVEKQNPAMRLYKRLGFVCVKDVNVYDLMEYKKAS